MSTNPGPSSQARTNVFMLTSENFINAFANTDIYFVATAATPNADSYHYSGNGVDDSIAINKALLAASVVGGGIVQLLPNTYTIRQQLFIPSNVQLVGAGRGKTTILVYRGTTYQTNKSSPICMAGVSNAACRNLTLDIATYSVAGNGITMIAANGFTGAVCNGCEVTGCEVLSNSQQNYLIWNYCATNSIITGNHINGGTLIDNHGVTSSTAFDQQGIEIYGGTNITVMYNEIRNVGNVAILIQSLSNAALDSSNNNIRVSNNFASNCAQFCQWISNYNNTLSIVQNLINLEVTNNQAEGIYVYGLYGNHVGDTTGVVCENILVANNQIIMANTNYATLPSGATSVTPISQVQREIFLANVMTTPTFLTCKNYSVSDNETSRGQPAAGGTATKPLWYLTAMNGVTFERNKHKSVTADMVAGTSVYGCVIAACTDIAASANIIDGCLTVGLSVASASNNVILDSWKIFNWNLADSGQSGVLMNDTAKWSLTGFNFKTSKPPNGSIVNLGTGVGFYVENNKMPYMANANNFYNLGSATDGNIGTFTLAAATTWTITSNQITPQSFVSVYPTTGTQPILTTVPTFGSASGTCASSTGVYQYRVFN